MCVSIPEEVLLVPMDVILIEQVIVNVMENAVLHGKTTTTISISITSDDQMVVFRIEDDGQGIREDMLPNLFEGGMHTQENEESDARRNMGIGLSVCMSIIKAHNGNMHAKNKKNGGAVFAFSLPMQEVNGYGN